jgi:dihydroflavonol-4-reductase
MILVTGGAGLVGKHLIIQLLARGKKVRAIYNKTPLHNFNNENFSATQCDILDVYALEEAMQDISEVYHCAAIISFAPKDEKILYKINVEGTANVVNACLYTGVKKLLHVSSIAALGRAKEGGMINENMHWSQEKSNSLYGHSKYLGELEVWRGVAEGLDAVIVNPVIILGDGNWNEGSTKIFKTVYDGFPWYTTGTTGFVGAKDLVKAMIALMQSNINNEQFIVSAENSTYQNVLCKIANGFNKKIPSKKVTPLIAAITWRLDAIKSFFTGSSPLITKETAATAQAQITFDNTKLLKALPEFSYESIDKTIKEVCVSLVQKNIATKH